MYIKFHALKALILFLGFLYPKNSKHLFFEIEWENCREIIRIGYQKNAIKVIGFIKNMEENRRL